MSQYVEFFLKTKDDNFICLDASSRNSWLYQILSIEINVPVPYGKIRETKPIFFENAINAAETQRNSLIESLESERKMASQISAFNNSVEEKLDALYQIREIINDYEDELEELNYAIGYFKTMHSIASNLEYESNGAKLYCGIEVGRPTIEDIAT